MELAALAEPAHVPQAVASVLGVYEQSGRPLSESLAHVLASRSLLLVLDNCEHLVEACAYLAWVLLRACPELRILATGRQPLGSDGETTWRVPSLSVPRAEHVTTPETLAECEAVRLFVDRAQAALPTFRIREENAPSVAEVCRQLDGIPLALELAAARMPGLSVQQIAQRLDDRFRLLAHGRRTALPQHQTLRRMIDWSYDLLSEPERVLLRRLAVFAGGWTLEAAEGICAGGGIESDDVRDLLTQLADQSLVMAEEQRGARRYRLLETVRQYGREKLREAGEEATLRGQHQAWFVALAEQAEPRLWGSEQLSWLDRLEAEIDNIRAALGWGPSSHERSDGTDDGTLEGGLRLAAALWHFWTVRSYVSEGRDWLEPLLAEADTPTVARARGLYAAGTLAFLQGDFAAARACAQEGLSLGRRLGDDYSIRWILLGLGILAWTAGDVEDASAFLEESLALSRSVGDEVCASGSLLFRARVALLQGEHERASPLFEECLTLTRARGDRWGTADVLLSLAVLSRMRVRYERATALTRESLILRRDLGSTPGIAECLEGLAGLAVEQGWPVRAARLFGAAEALRRAIGVPLLPSERAGHERDLTALRAALPDETIKAAWDEGRAMPLEQVIEFALAVEAPTQPSGTAVEPTASGPRASPLTSREREVAALVAQGLSNRAISEVLVIAERTVHAHVGNILRKLDFASRAQIAAWAVEQRLLTPRPD